jgi:hypothetical protein
LGAKNEMPVGRVNPLTTMSNLKEGSFSTGAAKALLSFDRNNKSMNKKEKTVHTNIILKVKGVMHGCLQQRKMYFY